MKNRLTPSTLVRTDFARLLVGLDVPAQIPFTTSDSRPPDNHTLVCRVPLVCAEFFDRWYLAGRSLHGLKLETVAQLARDAFVAEGGKLMTSMMLGFDTSKEHEVWGPRPMISSSALVWVNLAGAAKKP